MNPVQTGKSSCTSSLQLINVLYARVLYVNCTSAQFGLPFVSHLLLSVAKMQVACSVEKAMGISHCTAQLAMGIVHCTTQLAMGIAHCTA